MIYITGNMRLHQLRTLKKTKWISWCDWNRKDKFHRTLMKIFLRKKMGKISEEQAILEAAILFEERRNRYIGRKKKGEGTMTWQKEMGDFKNGD